MFRTRLQQLEKAARKSGLDVCRLCYGHPVAVVTVLSEPDPNGPGFRKTGECYLSDEQERINDDFCCRQCGKQAVLLCVRSVTGIAAGKCERLVRLPDHFDDGD